MCGHPCRIHGSTLWPDPVVSEKSIALKIQVFAGLSARTFGNVRRPILGDVTLCYVGFKTGFSDYLVILTTIIEFKQIEFSDITPYV
jgi:hypothetical protein